MATGVASVRAAFRQLDVVPSKALTELAEWFVPRSKQIGGRMLWFGKRRQLTSRILKRKAFERADEMVLVGIPISCWSIKSYGRVGGYDVFPRRKQALSIAAYGEAYFGRVTVSRSTPGDGRWDRLVAEAEVQFVGRVERLIDKAVA